MERKARRPLTRWLSAQQYQLYRLLWTAVDWVYPPNCVGCGVLGSRWCDSCLASVQRIAGVTCEICGKPGSRTPCSDCARSRPAFEALRSWSIYSGLPREAILRLKYRNDVGLGEAIGSQLANWFVSLDWGIDLVACVPLGRSRLRERGYNQAGLIARPFAMALGLSYQPHALSRVRETLSQVGLTVHERTENVRGAFSASGSHVSAKCVLVVDDVATTGSTLGACAEALLAVGASRVYALSAARAIGPAVVDDA